MQGDYTSKKGQARETPSIISRETNLHLGKSLPTKTILINNYLEMFQFKNKCNEKYESLKNDYKVMYEKYCEATYELKNTELKTEKTIYKATHKIELENERLKAENRILENALKEVGFSVADSKEMLSDLVKALGEKNKINIVK